MSQHRKIESGQSIIDAIEFLLENDLTPEIVTHRVLNDGVHAKYTWCVTESGGDVTLNFMDEDYVFPRSTFEETWKETYANGMFLPQLDEEQVTLLGDGESWVGGECATVFNLDPRFMIAMCCSDKTYNDLNKYPVLSEVAYSIESLVESSCVGEFTNSDLTVIFELARDQLAHNTDMTDEGMKSIQGKLQRHLNMNSGESEDHDIEPGMG